MRLLHRARPDRHGAEAVIPADPAEGPPFGEGAEDKGGGFLRPSPGLIGIDAVGQELVGRATQEKHDATPAAHRVEERQLLGDPHRVVHGDERPQHSDLGARQHLAQRRAHEKRVRREQPWRIVMLRRAHPVESQLVRKARQVEIDAVGAQRVLGPRRAPAASASRHSSRPRPRSRYWRRDTRPSSLPPMALPVREEYSNRPGRRTRQRERKRSDVNRTGVRSQENPPP